MFLTRRVLWAVLFGMLPVLLVPRPSTARFWLLVVTALVVIDIAAALSPREIRAERTVPYSVRLGESAAASLILTNRSERTAHLQVRDAWQPSAGAEGERHTVVLPAGQRRRLKVRLTPTRRGDRHADLVTLRSTGPLRMAGRQASLLAPAKLRVLPEFTARKHLPSKLARLRDMDGRSAVRVRGAGTEFDSLREYVVGDDVRSIDWRSTARRGEVVVRTWRPERDRRVLILLDTGRLSAARLGDAPRLDAQIEAALLLSALASKAGDRVDVVALDNEVRTQIRGRSGPTLMNALAEQLAPIEPQLVELNWTLLAQTVRSTLTQHALVVVLGAVDPSATDTEMLRTLSLLANDHTVVIASGSDPELEKLRTSREDSDAAYTAAAAERTVVEQHNLQSLLRKHGAELVEEAPDRLAPALADAYLSLKAAGRL